MSQLIRLGPFCDDASEGSEVKSLPTRPRRLVIIEGLHGVGKTTILRSVQYTQSPVLFENYLNLLLDPSAPHTVYEQLCWCGRWFSGVKDLLDSSEHSQESVWTDRCPLTSAIYGNAQLRDTLLEHLMKCLTDFLENFNLIADVHIILSDWDSLAKRVCQRFTTLLHDPEFRVRQKLAEDSKEHAMYISKEYTKFLEDPRFKHERIKYMVHQMSDLPDITTLYAQWN